MRKKQKRNICPIHGFPFTRKCYRCKKLLCKKCSFRKFHHYYCSKKCAFIHFFKTNKTLYKIREKPLETIAGKLLLYASLFTLVSIVILYIKNTQEEKAIFFPIFKKVISNREFFSPDDVKRIDTDDKAVFISFDGGSSADNVKDVLDILKKKNIPATFFLTGEFIERFPRETREIAKDFEVGNHLYTHPHLTNWNHNYTHKTSKNVNQLFLISEILLTEEAFKKVTGKDMKRIWRAPYGEHNKEIRKWAQRLGYTHIGWTYDTKDWMSENDPRFTNFDKILQDIENRIDMRGYIIMMHLGAKERKDNFYYFLWNLISIFEKKGYKFKGIYEALNESRANFKRPA